MLEDCCRRRSLHSVGAEAGERLISGDVLRRRSIATKQRGSGARFAPYGGRSRWWGSQWWKKLTSAAREVNGDVVGVYRRLHTVWSRVQGEAGFGGESKSLRTRGWVRSPPGWCEAWRFVGGGATPRRLLKGCSLRAACGAKERRGGAERRRPPGGAEVQKFCRTVLFQEISRKHPLQTSENSKKFWGER